MNREQTLRAVFTRRAIRARAHHGPWCHPHTAQMLGYLPHVISDPYGHDHAQREALLTMPWFGEGPALDRPLGPTMTAAWSHAAELERRRSA